MLLKRLKMHQADIMIKELAEKLVKYLFAPRNAIDPAEAYRMFRGRDANIEALMRDRGFPVE
jgi:peptidyl-dipeptidase Dcp